MMKKRNQYLRVVEWSEEDQCFIGRVPGLTLGGVHGKNEAKVYEKLGALIDEWIEIHETDGAPLPPATAGRKYSGRFNIRVGSALHERLAIESLKESESLNSYCVKVLKDEVGL
jgi:predicted HicB family RNase H-like nuclease